MASKPIMDGFAQKTRTDRGFFYALGFLQGRVTALQHQDIQRRALGEEEHTLGGFAQQPLPIAF